MTGREWAAVIVALGSLAEAWVSGRAAEAETIEIVRVVAEACASSTEGFHHAGQP